jgi:hypothetical protein
MNRTLSYVFLFLLAGVLFCTNDPKLIFPSATPFGRVTGYVVPADSKAHVYLSDSTVFDSTTISGVNGYFSFDSVAFGSYLVVIRAEGYAKYTCQYSLTYPVGYAGYFWLTTTPSQIYSFTPGNGIIIDSLYLARYVSSYDSNVTARVTFKQSMDTASVTRALSISPVMPYSTAWDLSGSNPALQIFLPIVRLFGTRQTIITISSSAKTADGEQMDTYFRCSLLADTSYSHSLRLRSFFGTTTPQNGATDITPPDKITVTFKMPMNQASVEKAFSMQPSLPVNFFWTPWNSYNGIQVLTVQFAAPLQAGTNYRVSLDSGYTSKDLSLSGPPMTLSFSTLPFTIDSYYPLNGAQSVPLDTPFTFSMNFACDSTSFKRALSLTPAVDSLKFSFYNTFVSVRHASLLPETAYTLVLDSQLTSTRGTPAGLRKVIQFKTGRQKSIASVIVNSTPYNFATNVPPSAKITLFFSGAVNRPSVEQHLHIVPAIPFTGLWNNDSATALCLTPVQPLKTRNVYRVVLDSLFLSQNLSPQKAVTVQFTTQPLTVTAIAPVNEQVGVSTVARFRVSFNTPLDTSTFLNHVHLSPAVDSLAIDTMYSEPPLYSIRHAALSKRTVYTITIDSTATDLYGTTSGAQFQALFTTE